jgi:hypothetical protein
MFGWTLYDHGRSLKSAFWRNDPALRLAGAADLPDDLYPDALPGMAFLRALDAPRYGSEGELHQQLTPSSYVGQNVTATGPEQVHVAAGNFTALKVTAQADVGTLMPNWPRFVLHVIRPFVPSNVLYFESTPPYRLLKQQGTTFVGGHEETGSQTGIQARPLLRGKLTLRDRHLINLDNQIPIYVAANGPLALKAAGVYGDG